MTHTEIGKIAVVGMFDGIHAGHHFLLDLLKHEGQQRQLMPLAITFANHPLEITDPQRAPALLSTPAEKAELLAQEGVMAEIVPFNNELRMTSANDFLSMLASRHNVRAMVLGFNNRFGHDAPRNPDTYRAMARSHGIELIEAPELPSGQGHISSSAIRALLSTKGDVAKAAQMLLHNYSITGEVAGGKQIGRTIGFPTANLIPNDSRKLIPLTGVYAAFATDHTGTTRPAVVNIGRRPTVENSDDAPVTIEAHIIDFSGNLYGTPLTLSFVNRIRPEQRFPHIEALRCQIETDRAEALRACSAV